MRAAVRFVAVAALLAVAGCAGGTPERPAAGSRETRPSHVRLLTAGDCLRADPADADGLGDVDVSDRLRVPCRRPHIYEVVARKVIPARLRKDWDRTHYDAAIQGDTGGYAPEDRLYEYADAYCARRTRAAMGLSKVRVNGWSAARAGVTVWYDRIGPLATAAEPDTWSDDAPAFVCMNRFTRRPTAYQRDNRLELHTRAVRGRLTPHVLDRRWPVALRDCGQRDDRTWKVSPTPCFQPHGVEHTIVFDARAALPPDLLRRERAKPETVPLSQDSFGRMTEACQSALPTVLGAGFDRDSLSVYPEAYGFAERGIPAHVSCLVIPEEWSDRLLPAGSVIGRLGRVPLVPVTPA